MDIKKATAKDVPAILKLLSECELPMEGVAEHPEKFLVSKNRGKILGCIGLESGRDTGLIRSLAVTESERGRGHGRRLVQEVLDRAADKNLKNACLLTIDAADYFRRFDFRVVNRNELDPEIQRIPAFNLQCCCSAVCMLRTMD